MATRLDAVTNVADFSVPSFVAESETAVIRIMLYGTGAALTNITFYIVSPDGYARDYVGSFRDVSAPLPLTFISLFEFSYAFLQGGHYLFSCTIRQPEACGSGQRSRLSGRQE